MVFDFVRLPARLASIGAFRDDETGEIDPFGIACSVLFSEGGPCVVAGLCWPPLVKPLRRVTGALRHLL
jgi:hypothetical protein